MNAGQLQAATGCTGAAALAFLGPLTTAIGRWGVLRVPEFLAQIAVESKSLKSLQEDLHYSARRLTEVWPTRFPSLAAAQPYAGNPEALANKVYGGRMGNNAPGDGWRYRGRGLKQLTGKENYAAYQTASGVPVLTTPDLLFDPVHAADSAAWFWFANGCDALADDTAALTKRINGGLTGLAQRQSFTAKAREAFA